MACCHKEKKMCIFIQKSLGRAMAQRYRRPITNIYGKNWNCLFLYLFISEYISLKNFAEPSVINKYKYFLNHNRASKYYKKTIRTIRGAKVHFCLPYFSFCMPTYILWHIIVLSSFYSKKNIKIAYGRICYNNKNHFPAFYTIEKRTASYT